MPFFSIIIPTYNRAHLIRDTLWSIHKQKFQDYEVLVIDDGGKDNTKEIVERLNDDRFRYYWKENAERGAARNFGANLAKGSILNFFDSDDIAFENHLSVAYEYFKSGTNDNTIYHTSYCFYLQDRHYDNTISIGRLNSKIIQSNCLSCNNVFIPKAIFEKEKFSEVRNLSASEDWDLWIRLSLIYSIVGVEDITSAIVQHDSRSMAIASGISTEIRSQSLLESLRPYLISRSDIVKNITSEMYSLSALHYALEGNRSDAFRCMIISIRSQLSVVFSRRFLAIIKHFVF